VAPNVKLNIIRDYEVVEKKEVRMPDELLLSRLKPIVMLLVICSTPSSCTTVKSFSEGIWSITVKLNIIRDYEVVEKKEVRMPDELRGIVKCANPKCITNNEPFHFFIGKMKIKEW